MQPHIDIMMFGSKNVRAMWVWTRQALAQSNGFIDAHFMFLSIGSIALDCFQSIGVAAECCDRSVRLAKDHVLFNSPCMMQARCPYPKLYGLQPFFVNLVGRKIVENARSTGKLLTCTKGVDGDMSLGRCAQSSWLRGKGAGLLSQCTLHAWFRTPYVLTLMICQVLTETLVLKSKKNTSTPNLVPEPMTAMLRALLVMLAKDAVKVTSLIQH